MWLEQIREPGDLRDLSYDDLEELAGEIRDFIVAAVAENAGHLGSNLGVVELTLALHRVFDSPHDALLWDTGHQAYVHKLVTGRRAGFANLRCRDGLSGYPSREESRHDFVENSHASTILSYAHGLAVARDLGGADHRHIVAVIGDGSMTGGMSYEALNNLGHSGNRVIVVLNDNGRSYAPTISNLTADRTGLVEGPETAPIVSRIGDALSHFLTDIRLNPVYVRRQRKLEELVRDVPLVGYPAERAVEAVKAAARKFLQPPAFFEALGVRYVGPVDGHDIGELEPALRNAIELSAEGPIVVHVVTQKGRGYPPAEDDDEKHLHDAPVFDPAVGPPKAVPTGYTQTFAETVIKLAEADHRIVAITAAMPGPTGLLPFQERFPERFFDVGIAEQHAVTAAAGMAMGGLRPIVAIYSTFLNRAWDQVVYDVALHRLPVLFCIDRAGVTGPDGPSHHGVFDMAMLARVPGMRVLAPSSAQELQVMMADAALLVADGPVAIRYPRGRARQVDEHEVGSGLAARCVSRAADRERAACVIAIGKLLAAAERAAEELAEAGIDVTVWDARCCAPPDLEMLVDAAAHSAVVTAEDGVREGGIGATIAAKVCELSPGTVTRTLGLPTRFIPHAGSPEEILSALGLDHAGIAATVREVLAAATDG
ncbi:MAG: 1-deoxy-D-xylulose-5-phosphate synthase [Ilumatobacteraceae bacterium]